jgi:hypothetical protein
MEAALGGRPADEWPAPWASGWQGFKRPSQGSGDGDALRSGRSGSTLSCGGGRAMLLGSHSYLHRCKLTELAQRMLS